MPFGRLRKCPQLPMTAARDQLHPTILKTRNRFVLNRARGFESHHLRQQKAPAQAGAFFCGKDGEDENRAAVRRPQAISPAGCCLARGRISTISANKRHQLRLVPFYVLQPLKRMYQYFLLRIFSSVSANLTSCSFVRFGLPLGCFPARRSFLFS